MIKIHILIPMLFLLISNSIICAHELPDERFMRKFEADLEYKYGFIDICDNKAVLKLSEGYRYLEGNNAKNVLEIVWGMQSSKQMAGLILPPGIGPFSQDAWGFVVSFDESGHIQDTDSITLNKDILISKLRLDQETENKERQDKGHQTIQIVDWEMAPMYHIKSHTLSWALEYDFSNEIQHIVIFNIKKLGRTGILTLNAIIGKNVYESSRNSLIDALSFSEFNKDYKYDDFDKNGDPVSKSTLSDIVTGQEKNELSFRQRLIERILSARRFIILIIFASVYLLIRHLRNKKNNEV